MSLAIIQSPLAEREMSQLSKEFPRLEFCYFSRYSTHAIPKETWEKGEIFYGEYLSKDHLDMATDLHWIHTPSSSTSDLCLESLESRSNILISYTPETNIFQIGEYVLAGVLSFAKNFFHWKSLNASPSVLWDSKWRNNMWTLQDKIFLQIGLSRAGLEAAKRASASGMKVWGVSKQRSFYPFCHQNFSLSELQELLPLADVVSLICPRGQKAPDLLLGQKELSLMKDDSILSLLGSNALFDEEVLYELASGGKFRGILIDAHYKKAIGMHSKLWQIQNLLLTPEVAHRPKAPSRESFQIFRFNLRQYLLGNFSEMKHLLL